MLSCLNQKDHQSQTITNDNVERLNEGVWIDLLCPTTVEIEIIETFLGFKIPTRAEMNGIEFSSRLYSENEALFMTATIIAEADSPNPQLDAVTFILTGKKLITIRFIEPRSFKLYSLQILPKLGHINLDGIHIFLDLLNAIIDRKADILETVGHRLNDYSNTIFNQAKPRENPDYQALLRQIGFISNLNSKSRESLVTLSRLITFATQSIDLKYNQEKHLQLELLSKDTHSLSDHANFLASKISFLLDATLGLINIEQNNIIKIFSVAAVVFLPPTLIASVFGMNFRFIPAFTYHYGYYFALFLMGCSAFLPYKFAKYKKWL